MSFFTLLSAGHDLLARPVRLNDERYFFERKNDDVSVRMNTQHTPLADVHICSFINDICLWTRFIVATYIIKLFLPVGLRPTHKLVRFDTKLPEVDLFLEKYFSPHSLELFEVEEINVIYNRSEAKYEEKTLMK